MIIPNQLENILNYKKNIKFKLNFKSYLKLFVDITSLFVILSLFYGEGLLLFRVIHIIMPFYLFLFLVNCRVIIDEIGIYYESTSFKFNWMINKKSIQVFLILTIFSLSVTLYDTKASYTEEQYEACYWIRDNLPEESRFVAAVLLTDLISGLTMMWATEYMNRFYYDFDNDEIKVSYHPESRLFLFIDKDPPHTFSKFLSL